MVFYSFLHLLKAPYLQWFQGLKQPVWKQKGLAWVIYKLRLRHSRGVLRHLLCFLQRTRLDNIYTNIQTLSWYPRHSNLRFATSSSPLRLLLWTLCYWVALYSSKFTYLKTNAENHYLSTCLRLKILACHLRSHKRRKDGEHVEREETRCAKFIKLHSNPLERVRVVREVG